MHGVAWLIHDYHIIMAALWNTHSSSANTPRYNTARNSPLGTRNPEIHAGLVNPETEACSDILFTQISAHFTIKVARLLLPSWQNVKAPGRHRRADQSFKSSNWASSLHCPINSQHGRFLFLNGLCGRGLLCLRWMLLLSFDLFRWRYVVLL